MTTTPATTVVGSALYIEATRVAGTKYVMQILLTPEIFISPENIVNMAMFRRRISSVEPRKTWRHFSSASNSAKIRAMESPLVVDNEKMSNNLLSYCRTTMQSLLEPTNGYKIVGQPIVVEVTAADIEDIRLGKTPYKIFGRVWKSRKKLGYPANFLV